MKSNSKMMLSLVMVLAILLAEFKGGESGTFFSKIAIVINNQLGDQSLGAHCKDKHHDNGYQNISRGGTYTFKIVPDPFMKSTLWFCRFIWIDTVRYFDVFKQERDEADCDDKCNWLIYKTGPCKVKPTERECFKWNEPPREYNKLGQGNNTTLGV